jgi:hypothetical protein
VAPSARGGLHPLIVPLSRAPDGQARPSRCIAALTAASHALGPSLQLTALLRWPTTPDAFFPLQLVRPAGTALSLRARSASEFLHRALAEEDAAGGARPVAEALRGEALPFAYTPGAAAARPATSVPARHSALDVYLARAAGKFDDVARRLVAGHLTAGDPASALVTVDWYSGGDHFKGWAAPQAFAAHFLAQLGRNDEARDAARTALARGPFWSLGAPLAPTAALAGFAGRSAADIRAAVADGGIALDPALKQAKTAAQRALDAAELALDRVSAGEASWDDVAAELAEAYAAAGLSEVSRLVGARPQQ